MSPDFIFHVYLQHSFNHQALSGHVLCTQYGINRPGVRSDEFQPIRELCRGSARWAVVGDSPQSIQTHVWIDLAK